MTLTKRPGPVVQPAAASWPRLRGKRWRFELPPFGQYLQCHHCKRLQANIERQVPGSQTQFLSEAALGLRQGAHT